MHLSNNISNSMDCCIFKNHKKSFKPIKPCCDETPDVSNETSLLKIESINNDGEVHKNTKTDFNENENKMFVILLIIKNYPVKIYKFLFMKMFGKIIIIFIFLLYSSFSIWRIINIDKSLDVRNSVPDKSYLKEYLNDLLSNDLSPPVMLVFNEPLDYQNKNIKKKIKKFLHEAESLKGISKTFIIMNTLIFERIGNNIFTNETIKLHEIKSFFNDIIFRYNETKNYYQVQAVRFYLQLEKFQFNSKDTEIMEKLYDMCEKFNLPVLVYSVPFKNIELFNKLPIDLLQFFTIVIESAYLLSLLFILNLKTTFCIVFSVASIFMGFCGFMSVWDVPLNFITIIDYFIGLAFSLTSSAYIVHLFLIEFGKKLKRRADL
jgi:hypothetical protein